MKYYFVYILASGKNGTLYIGITNNVERRILEHKTGVIAGFTKKHKIHSLVYYEDYRYINEAIKREKQLKLWKRAWKIDLIEKNNPMWKDLCSTGN